MVLDLKREHAQSRRQPDQKPRYCGGDYNQYYYPGAAGDDSVNESLLNTIKLLMIENKSLKLQLEKAMVHDGPSSQLQCSRHCKGCVNRRGSDDTPDWSKLKEDSSCSSAVYKCPRHFDEKSSKVFGKCRETKRICWFYLNNRCRFGSKCWYLHKREKCLYFIKNRCKFGQRCWHLHEEQEVSKHEADLLNKEAKDAEVLEVSIRARKTKDNESNYGENSDENNIRATSEECLDEDLSEADTIYVEAEDEDVIESEDDATKLSTDLSSNFKESLEDSFNMQVNEDSICDKMGKLTKTQKRKLRRKELKCRSRNESLLQKIEMLRQKMEINNQDYCMIAKGYDTNESSIEYTSLDIVELKKEVGDDTVRKMTEPEMAKAIKERKQK